MSSQTPVFPFVEPNLCAKSSNPFPKEQGLRYYDYKHSATSPLYGWWDRCAVADGCIKHLTFTFAEKDPVLKYKKELK